MVQASGLSRAGPLVSRTRGGSPPDFKLRPEVGITGAECLFRAFQSGDASAAVQSPVENLGPVCRVAPAFASGVISCRDPRACLGLVFGPMWIDLEGLSGIGAVF